MERRSSKKHSRANGKRQNGMRLFYKKDTRKRSTNLTKIYAKN